MNSLNQKLSRDLKAQHCLIVCFLTGYHEIAETLKLMTSKIYLPMAIKHAASKPALSFHSSFVRKYVEIAVSPLNKDNV